MSPPLRWASSTSYLCTLRSLPAQIESLEAGEAMTAGGVFVTGVATGVDDFALAATFGGQLTSGISSPYFKLRHTYLTVMVSLLAVLSHLHTLLRLFPCVTEHLNQFSAIISPSRNAELVSSVLLP